MSGEAGEPMKTTDRGVGLFSSDVPGFPYMDSSIFVHKIISSSPWFFTLKIAIDIYILFTLFYNIQALIAFYIMYSKNGNFFYFNQPSSPTDNASSNFDLHVLLRSSTLATPSDA